MNVTILPSKLNGTIEAIPSKSHAHRILIAQKLAQLQGQEGSGACGGSDFGRLKIPTFSVDIEATKSCLRALSDASPVMDCHESGSTIRFMIPVTMALKETATFKGSGKLPQRPLSPLKEEMERHGVSFDMTGLTGDNVTICSCTGRLLPGEYSLAGNVSSQFITGLLFALPLLDGDSKLQLTTSLESSGYVDLTLDVLSAFGIEIKQSENDGLISYEIPGRQVYREPEDLKLDGDWSNASFWLAAGALGGDITVTGLNMDSSQKDKEISEVIKEMGADVTEGDSALRVKGTGALGSVHVSAAQTPDMVPVLAALMAGAVGTSQITDAGRLRIKESDRLETVREYLSLLGCDITSTDTGLTVCGTGRLAGGRVSSHNDHRIAMAAAIASCICEEPVTIEDAGAVAKSYPNFWEDFARLGGKVNKE
ncbi:MAG: 3-phosphoshikimate 1-carboxyvinyltransferase [Firmicutes bacterium]|nr:3-phosphoshikimate 1-carboxyvinyltransferase [Bacillota bacterium]